MTSTAFAADADLPKVLRAVADALEAERDKTPVFAELSSKTSFISRSEIEYTHAELRVSVEGSVPSPRLIWS